MSGQAVHQAVNAARLRELMEAHDMRAEELAFRVHVSASTVQRWLSGRNAPTFAASVALAALFGVPREEFYA